MKTVIEEIINDWDPLDLFPGAPKDEYENEIQSITLLLEHMSNIENIALEIRNIFIKSFGDGVFCKNFNECLLIAKTIAEKLK